MKRMKTERAGGQTILSTFGDNVFGFLGGISEHTKMTNRVSQASFFII
jgi:hypothetical protein